MNIRFVILSLISLYGLVASDSRAGEAMSGAVFLKSHCLDCHRGDESAAGLDLERLVTQDMSEAVSAWASVYDRVHSLEMPPKDADQPSGEARDRFLSTLKSELTAKQEAEFRSLGRVRGRRLTNRQLEKTLHDLLGIDIPLATLMPEELRTNGYASVAAGQTMSHFQLQTHLTVVDAALDEAFRRVQSDKDEWTRSLTAEDIARTNPRRRCREPEMLKGDAVVWSSRLIFYGRLPVTTAREDGWYRLTVKASSLNTPKDHGVWCTVRTGPCVSSAPLMAWAGAFEAGESPVMRSFEAWLPKGHMFEIRPGDDTLKMARFDGGQVGTGEGEPQKVPGVAIHEATLERIHHGADDESIHRILFGNLKLNSDRRGRNPVLESKAPRADATRLIKDFARRAFRRPVSDEELSPYLTLALENLSNGVPLYQALRQGYRAILCSPRFLHFQESQPLDDHAIACRLSYFLWSSMPDDELFQLAERGQLRQPEILKQQVGRMLSTPRGQDFVRDFAFEWLDLKDIDFTEPDRRLYPGFDVIVQQAMLDETHAFLQTMLNENLSVGNLIDSSFTYLNARLARYYRIPNVDGDHLQKVSLKPDDHRGGVLTQGSIMKVTANGTTTSPVVRGVWISERLLGVDIPAPPQGVPAIEPDVRGAKSIRDLLEKHKSDVSCASCHVKIDPPGFAVENFDPSGRWRNQYATAGRSRKGEGPRVDPSNDLPDGRHFDGLRQFQSLILDDKATLAANVARHLLTYGTGAVCQFADRDDIDQVVNLAAESDYGFRSILEAVVLSEPFLNK